MLHEEIYTIGRIAKTHGLDGTVSVVLQSDDVEIFDWELVFIEIHKKPTPFFIEEMQARGNDILLKFADYENIDQVAEFIGCSVAVPLDYKTEETEDELSQLVGYWVLDQTGAQIGQVEEIIYYPMNVLLQVRNADKELLIPANDNIVTRIDNEKKCLFCTLPDGLLELNDKE